jgi:hypothetical protein
MVKGRPSVGRVVRVGPGLEQDRKTPGWSFPTLSIKPDQPDCSSIGTVTLPPSVTCSLYSWNPQLSGSSAIMLGVPSWRDAASPEAQADLDGLLNAALPFAQEMLRTRGEFYPYGVALARSGEHTMLVGDDDATDRPPSADVFATLLAGVQAQRDDLRAVALVADVRADSSDAIRVELEHREGSVMAVLLPYKRHRLRGGVDFGELVAGTTAPKVWR